MRHYALFFGDLGNPTSTTLTPGNGISASGNTITVTPTFTPQNGSVTASYLTFANADNSATVQIPVTIFPNG